MRSKEEWKEIERQHRKDRRREAFIDFLFLVIVFMLGATILYIRDM